MWLVGAPGKADLVPRTVTFVGGRCRRRTLLSASGPLLCEAPLSREAVAQQDV